MDVIEDQKGIATDRGGTEGELPTERFSLADKVYRLVGELRRQLATAKRREQAQKEQLDALAPLKSKLHSTEHELRLAKQRCKNLQKKADVFRSLIASETVKAPIKAIAPIAEYFGVAVMEIEGDKRTVWNGVEYGTDGFTYLMRKAISNGHVQILKCQSEEAAKVFIDHPDNAEREKYCSYREAWLVIGHGKLIPRVDRWCEWIDRGGHWTWDDDQKVFIPVKPR